MIKYKVGTTIHISLTGKIVATNGEVTFVRVETGQDVQYIKIVKALLIPEEECYDTREDKEEEERAKDS